MRQCDKCGSTLPSILGVVFGQPLKQAFKECSPRCPNCGVIQQSLIMRWMSLIISLAVTSGIALATVRTIGRMPANDVDRLGELLLSFYLVLGLVSGFYFLGFLIGGVVNTIRERKQ